MFTSSYRDRKFDILAAFFVRRFTCEAVEWTRQRCRFGRRRAEVVVRAFPAVARSRVDGSWQPATGEQMKNMKQGCQNDDRQSAEGQREQLILHHLINRGRPRRLYIGDMDFKSLWSLVMPPLTAWLMSFLISGL
jgi:hypothetical protein